MQANPIICVLLILGAALLVTGAVMAVFYFLSLPLRRMERARFFLDLLEDSLRRGQPPEREIAGVTRTADPALGRPLLLFGDLLAQGLNWSQALEASPAFLPPRLAAMLTVGTRAGELRGMIAAARRHLGDGLSATRGAMNYAIVLMCSSLPLIGALFAMLLIFVVPKLRAILEEMEVPLPPTFEPMVQYSGPILAGLGAVGVALAAAVILFVGGPSLMRRLRRWFGPRVDHVALVVPWKRRRILRDFAAVLGLMLDQGVPEPKAIQLAAEAADNAALRTRADQVVHDLAQGTGLGDALGRIDPDGELQWRFRNAQYHGRGFAEALGGWIDALDAEAFRQEQAAAQYLSTGIVLLSGVVVAFIATSMFATLIAVIEGGVLW